MDDSALTGELQDRRHVPHDGDGVVYLHRPMVLEMVGKRAARHILHENVAKPGVRILSDVIRLHEVRVLHPHRKLGFAEEPLACLVVGGRRLVKELRRDFLPHRRAQKPHLSHAALAEPPYDAKFAKKTAF